MTDSEEVSEEVELSEVPQKRRGPKPGFVSDKKALRHRIASLMKGARWAPVRSVFEQEPLALPEDVREHFIRTTGEAYRLPSVRMIAREMRKRAGVNVERLVRSSSKPIKDSAPAKVSSAPFAPKYSDEFLEKWWALRQTQTQAGTAAKLGVSKNSGSWIDSRAKAWREKHPVTPPVAPAQAEALAVRFTPPTPPKSAVAAAMMTVADALSSLTKEEQLRVMEAVSVLLGILKK